ncbi:hypothetical protein DMH17_15165 [Raoultella planticola]|nr:hypothetical protein [Raoultella planticola]
MGGQRRGQTYTFHLRDGVKFHNGDTMTAQDVVWSWKHWTDRRPSGDVYVNSTARPDSRLPTSVRRITLRW